MSNVEIKTISGGVGVELANIDISKGVSEADFETIQSALSIMDWCFSVTKISAQSNILNLPSAGVR